MLYEIICTKIFVFSVHSSIIYISQKIILFYFSKQFFFFFKILFIYSCERQRTKAEGETVSLQGARCRTRSQDPGITLWAKSKRSTAEPPRHPIASWDFCSNVMSYCVLNYIKPGPGQVLSCEGLLPESRLPFWALVRSLTLRLRRPFLFEFHGGSQGTCPKDRPG